MMCVIDGTRGMAVPAGQWSVTGAPESLGCDVVARNA